MKAFLKENKVILIKLLISLLLVILGAIVSNFNEQISFIIYIVAYILIAYKTIYKGIVKLFKDAEVGERLLMTIASLGAIIIGELFEASLIIILYEIGELVERGAKKGSRNSVEKLLSIRPEKARLKLTGEHVCVGEVEIDQLVEIYPGERIPLDGVVYDGVASVDTSIITGESDPREVRQGGEVLAGCINLDSVITVKVTRKSTQSAAQRIIDLAEKSLEKKTKGERFITKFARIYTPIVCGVAFLVAVIPTIFGLDMLEWCNRAFSMLAISCPCALVISIPLAYYCAIGHASKRGILIKDSLTLEKLDELNMISFDKTGTLTKSDLHVTKIEAYGDYTKIKLLELACIVEATSSHPLAVAVRNEAKRFKINVSKGENYVEKAGFGVECDSEYGHIKAGNKAFVGAYTGSNVGTIFVSVNNVYVGYVGVGDDLKPNSKRAFDELRALGIEKMFILSGDKKSKVDAVASALYADGAYSQLLPETKLNALEDIIKEHEGARMGYCGDGINDLPCLSRADVGISMGAIGSDVAVEKSDIIIMDDDLEKLPKAILIAKKTKKIAIFNIVFSIAIKAILLALSLIFPAFPIWVAVLGDVGTMLIAVTIAIRAGK